MKKAHLLWVGCWAFLHSTMIFAQNPDYGKVLYRINSGGAEKASIDTSQVTWMRDDLQLPSPFVDTVAMGNKSFSTAEFIVLDASVPTSTPASVFNSERALPKWDITTLEFDFPVNAGKKIEVRLYFAEIYWSDAEVRIFDVLLDDQLVLDNYDIFAEEGPNVGVMKSYTLTSDGNLDIDLRREKQQPKISAIEIIEIEEPVIAGIFGNTITNNKSSIYPNPFIDKFQVELPGHEISFIQVSDQSGKEVQLLELSKNNFGYTIDLSNQSKGVYFLRIQTDEDYFEMRKIIKY